MDRTQVLQDTPVELDIEGHTIPVTMILTRSGRVVIRLPEPQVLNHEPEGVFDRPHLQKFYSELSGKTSAGERVKLNNVHATFEGRGSDPGLRLKEIPSVSMARVGTLENTSCHQFTVEYTIVNLRPLIAESTNYEPLISGDSWTAEVKDLDSTSPATIFEASAMVRITLHPASNTLEKSLSETTAKLKKILTVAKFFQGCGNDWISCDVVEANGESAPRYKMFHEADANLGAAFHVDTLLARNIRDSFEQVYRLIENGPELITMLIDSYVDALNQTRTRHDRMEAVKLGLTSYLNQYDTDPEEMKSTDLITVFQSQGIHTDDLTHLESALTSAFSLRPTPVQSKPHQSDRKYTTLVVLLIRTIEEVMMGDTQIEPLFDARPEELRALL